MDLSLRERETERQRRKLEYQERKKPDNQSDNRYHIIIRGENAQPQPGMEPSASKMSFNEVTQEQAGGPSTRKR